MRRDPPTPDEDANRDPISGAPGAHPIGTGVGAAVGGAAAGAVAGTVVGPLGTIIGAAVGAVIGGLAGKDVAEVIDPTREDTESLDGSGDHGGHHDSHHDGDRVALDSGSIADDGPAYGFGARARDRYPDRDFDAVEAALSSDWAASRGGTGLSWAQARHAARDGWNRAGPSRGSA